MSSMYVYILTNNQNYIFYVGVTNDLVRRVYEHKHKLIAGFTSIYNINKLVYYECYDDPYIAIQREKNLKHYVKEWKIDLVNKLNPDWKDLYYDLLK